jgi:2'-5' RNA ligase
MIESAALGNYRLFLAISLPEDVISEVKAIQRSLKKVVSTSEVKWTNREQQHLTMKFLGNVPADQCPALLSAVNETCASFPPLRLTASRVGMFPNARNPRVIWIGVGDSAGMLPKLHASLETRVASFTAEKPENRFQAHVTIARVKQMRREEAEYLAQDAARFDSNILGSWTASRLDLIRSQLSSQGATYSILGSAAFSAPPSKNDFRQTKPPHEPDLR